VPCRPDNIKIPSLSIVVGLMLVFRNQTAYSRFWNGRCHLNTVTTAVRCLSRQILVLVPAPTFSGLSSMMSSDSFLPNTSKLSRDSTNGDKLSISGENVLSPTDQAKTIETVKILIAMLYTIKNHLRAEWGVALSPGTSLTADGQEANTDEYKDLLPPGLKGFEHRGLGLTLELACFVEKYIQMGVKKYEQFLLSRTNTDVISRKWFHNAASGTMISHLDGLTSAYGSMEVIRLVPIPVAHLQVSIVFPQVQV
jgi:ion channel-forming bestrophin family protein